jgi:hypothetical protein
MMLLFICTGVSMLGNGHLPDLFLPGMSEMFVGLF